MAIAVIAVTVMQVIADDVVAVVVVGNRRVAASVTVRVIVRVARAIVIVARNGAGKRMLVDVIAVRIVKMPVVRVVGVIAVLNARVPAAVAVSMVVS